jgi:hypothetical protein
VISLAAGCVLVVIAAMCFAALLRPRGVVAFALATGLLAFAEVVAVSHLLSFADAYEKSWFLGAVAIVAMAAAAATVIWRPPRPPFVRRAVAQELLRDRLLAVVAGIVAVELIYLFALAVFTPPNDLDGLQYHLTRALLWIQQESVAPVSDAADPQITEFPPNAEIVQGATMLLSESVRWVGLVQLAALLAAVVAIYGIGCRLGLARPGAAFGALVFATLPAVALQAHTSMNDLVVAALVAGAVYFTLGRSTGELALACLAVALLVGTKVTGFLALPVLLAVAALTHRGRRLALLLAGGLGAVVIGAAWLSVNVSAGNGLFGRRGQESGGSDDGVLAIAARFTRHAVEAVELPGATGKDRFVYLVAAGLVAICGAIAGSFSVAVVGAVVTALAILVLPVERALHSVYWNGWELAGYDEATELGAERDSTLASYGDSWYGPVGLGLTLVAMGLTVREARRGQLPWVAVVLAAAPVAFIVGTSVAVEYHPLSGRFVMGGVALSAATWGLVRRFQPGAVAVVTLAATTLLLLLANSTEKPAGFDLFEATGRPSVWTLPRAWVQNTQPELAVVTAYVDERAMDGATIGLTRDPSVRPFVYVGYPDIRHRLVYADTLREATRRGADIVVLPLSAACEPGWELGLRSPPWAVYRQVPGASCR